MKSVKLFSVVFALLFFLQSCGGEMSTSFDLFSYVSKDVLDEIKPEDFPDDDAIIITRKRMHLAEVFLNSSESVTTTSDVMVAKVLTEKGMKDFGTFTSDVYPEGTNYKVEVLVYQPDGSKVVLGGENVKKEKIGKKHFRYKVAIPGLQIGSVVLRRETIKRRVADRPPILAGSWDFSSRYYTINSELVLKIPRAFGMKFIFTPKSQEIKPEIKKGNPSKLFSYNIYRFVKHNLKKFKIEPNMPMEFAYNPSLVYFPWKFEYKRFNKDSGYIEGVTEMWSWSDEIEFLYDYFTPSFWEKHLKKEEEYRAELGKFMSSLKDSVDVTSVDDVLDYFYKHFDVVNSSVSITDVIPERIFSSKEGGPYSVAYALARVFERLGYYTEILLLRDFDDGALDRRVIDAAQLNHPILIVEKDGENYSIDPTSEALRSDEISWRCQGVKGVRINPESRTFDFITMPVMSCLNNVISRLDTIVVDRDGNIKGRAIITISGQPLYAMYIKAGKRELDVSDNVIKSYLKKEFPVTFNLSDTSLRFSGKDTLKLQVDYASDGIFQVAGSMINMDFSSWLYVPSRSVFDSDSRKYDILFRYPEVVKNYMVVKLPEGYSLYENVREISTRNDYFMYERRCEQDGDNLRFRRELRVLERRISVSDYTKAKAFTSEIISYDRENVVIKKM